MRDHFINKIIELVPKYPNLILITGDLGFGVLDEFRSLYPDNFINAGVAEQNMTGIAAGMALEGKIVLTYSIANFSTLRCLEQIRNDVCYHNANVKIISVGGGFSYGALGMSHHATEDLSIMRSIPQLSLLSPSTLLEAEMSAKIVLENKGPFYIRLDKSSGRDAEKSESKLLLEYGKCRQLSNGTDFSIFVTGGILEEVWSAKGILKKLGYNIRIITVPWLNPFDPDLLIKAINETNGIMTIEENVLNGGLGGLISEILMDKGVSPKFFFRMGLKSKFSSIVGSQKYLREFHGLNSKSIVRNILKFLK
jgi:transketolase